MSFNRLPSNSEQLLVELVQAENPTQVLCNRFERASQKEGDELRGILRELRLYGYIDIKWADNLPYFVILNNSAKTYNEEIKKYESHNTTKTIQAGKVNPIIFISHRSTDKEIADMLTDFFSRAGIPTNAIFCSSLPGNDINEQISKEVKSALRNSAVNIAILSQDYYQSAYCLNEAGILWFQDNIKTIPIALPEISPSNKRGFLNSEYKLRRLDSAEDISYIYDTVSEAISAPRAKVSVITSENQKLRERYANFLNARKVPTQLETTPAIPTLEVTTDDEKIVLWYILKNNARKVSKRVITDWLHKSEIYNVNIDNAFDLLSSLDGRTVTNDILELEFSTFQEFSANSSTIFPELDECVKRHTEIAADTFQNLWVSNKHNPIFVLFISYIIDEEMYLFRSYWTAGEQIKGIKEWERKNSLGSTLSSNYGKCLDIFIQNNLVYESHWTNTGDPNEYTLCQSLKKYLFGCPIELAETLREIKNEQMRF